MAKSNIILSELMEISPVVAKLPDEQPFVVPVGYFEQLADQVVDRIKSQAEQDSSVLSEVTKVNNPFSVPEGYFDRLAGDILNRVSEPSSPAEELERLSPVLSKLEKKSPFTVPDGYFSEMPSNVVAGIKAIDFVQAELEIVPSQLLEMKKINVFTVPEGYFEALPQQILKKVKPKTKILSFDFPSRIVRYAAAAAVIGVMAIAFLVFNRENDTYVADTTTNAELESGIKNVSDEEIKNYVENNATSLPDPTNATGADLQQQDMKDMLAEVSDKDIEEYLEEYGISKEELTN